MAMTDQQNADINAYWHANQGDAAQIIKAMEDYGVSAADLAAATGQTTEAINSWKDANTVAPDAPENFETRDTSNDDPNRAVHQNTPAPVNTESKGGAWTQDNLDQIAEIWNDPNVSMGEKTSLMSQYGVSASDVATATGKDIGSISQQLQASGEVSSGFGGAEWEPAALEKFDDINTPEGRQQAQEFFLANKDDPQAIFQAMKANGMDINTLNDLMSYNGLFNLSDVDQQYGGAEMWARKNGAKDGDIKGLKVYTPEEVKQYQEYVKAVSPYFNHGLTGVPDDVQSQINMQGFYDERAKKQGLKDERSGTGYSLSEGYGGYAAPWTGDSKNWVGDFKNTRTRDASGDVIPGGGAGPNYARDNAPGGVNNGGSYPTSSQASGATPTPTPTPTPAPAAAPAPAPVQKTGGSEALFSGISSKASTESAAPAPTMAPDNTTDKAKSRLQQYVDSLMARK